jgi:hypothetical protein
MQFDNKKTLAVVSAIIFCPLFYLGYTQWKEMTESAYMSCLGSVSTAIKKSKSLDKFVANQPDWKILSEDETKLLMQNIRGGDCVNSDNQTLDLWNHQIRIALKKKSDKINFAVWSIGADGISGTEDDIIFPEYEKIPQ